MSNSDPRFSAANEGVKITLLPPRAHTKMKVGQTLSQRGLAFRANYDVSTIRRRGERFKVFVNGDKVAWRETWEKQHFMRSGVTHGYKLVEIEA